MPSSRPCAPARAALRLLAGVLLAVAGWPAHAEWLGELRLLSDYNHRGYSMSRGDPVVQGKLDYQSGDGWYAGAVVSRVRFDDTLNDDRASLQLAPYAGMSWMLAPAWRIEASAAGYVYNGKLFAQSANYVEFAGSLHYSHWLSLKAVFAPDAYGTGADVPGLELNVRQDVTDTIQFSATAGYSKARSLVEHDYRYWNAGLSWYLTPKLVLDARCTGVSVGRHRQYIDTYPHEFYPRRQQHDVLVSLTLGF